MATQVLPIDSLMKEVSALIERELYQMLDKYMKNYKKYKKTYKHIMKLPAIRKLKEYKKMKEGSKGNIGIIRMLVNQINELTAQVSTLKTALYNYETIPERREQENISLKITEPTLEEIIADTGIKIYAELIENTQPQQTNSNITQTKVVKLDARAVVSEGGGEDDEDELEEDTEDEEEEEEEEEEDEEEEEEEEEEEKKEAVTEADEEEEEAEEEEVFEIEIDDKTYYTNNEENGIIYEALPNDEVGEKIGYLKDGEPFFTNIV